MYGCLNVNGGIGKLAYEFYQSTYTYVSKGSYCSCLKVGAKIVSRHRGYGNYKTVPTVAKTPVISCVRIALATKGWPVLTLFGSKQQLFTVHPYKPESFWIKVHNFLEIMEVV